MSRSFLVAQMLGETLSVADIAKDLKQPLNEAQTIIKDEPLEKTYKQYVLKGKVYSPVGDVTLADSLKSYAYEINLTQTGPEFVRVKPLTDNLMIFENSAMRKVVEEIDKFWQRKEQYDKLGLMHNRGILMYGPPGTGKSCALQQVVEMMVKRGDVVFFAKSPSAILEGLRAFRDVEPDRRVVVCFEEADELAQYDERKLLQLMDGDCKIDNTLFLATTNYIERLSPRMLRPGRFDKKVYIGTPNLEARRHYLTQKLKTITDAKMIEHLATQSDGMGFGHLRELIAGVFAIGDPVEEVLDRLRDKPIVEKGPKQISPSPSAYYSESEGRKCKKCGTSIPESRIVPLCQGCSESKTDRNRSEKTRSFLNSMLNGEDPRKHFPNLAKLESEERKCQNCGAAVPAERVAAYCDDCIDANMKPENRDFAKKWTKRKQEAQVSVSPSRRLLESVIDYKERLRRLKQRRDPDGIESDESPRSHRD